MTAFVFANFIDTTLAAATASTADTFSLSSSANLPVLGPGEIMPLVLNDAATGRVYEIVYVTAISGTTLTVLRGQEGTSAQNWSASDYIFSAFTTGSTAPVNGTHSPVASETLPAVNHLVVTPGTLTAAIDLTLNDQAAAGSSVTAFGSAAAYEVTVQSPVTSGSPYIELPDGSQVYSWVIPAGASEQGIHADWDGTNWRARTFGQTVVGAATADNEAVNLGQMLVGNRKSVYTANGNYTVPAGVTTIWVSGCAAGGGGGGGGGTVGSTGNVGSGGGGGGGAGQPAIRTPFAVSAGDSLAVVIGGAGAGGAGGANTGTNGSNGADGGNSTLTNTTTSTLLLTLTGGSGGSGGSGQASTTATTPNGGAGGSGGSGYPAGSYGSDGNYTGNGGAGASGPFGGGGGGGRAGLGGGEPAFGGYGYGSGGGGGGASYGSGAGAGGAGGAGSSGYMVIEW